MNEARALRLHIQLTSVYPPPSGDNGHGESSNAAGLKDSRQETAGLGRHSIGR